MSRVGYRRFTVRHARPRAGLLRLQVESKRLLLLDGMIRATVRWRHSSRRAGGDQGGGARALPTNTSSCRISSWMMGYTVLVRPFPSSPRNRRVTPIISKMNTNSTRINEAGNIYKRNEKNQAFKRKTSLPTQQRL